jgi:chloramphenicol-sensitive protein RarD
MKEKEEAQSLKNQVLSGTWYGIGAFVLWGVLPLYWKALDAVPSLEILAHRIVWSFVFVTILLFVSGRLKQVKEILVKRNNRVAMLISALLISGNWFIYIWAINTEHVIEASLGYYINPLLSVALGMIVLKERLNFWQLISLFLATVGVLFITYQYGKVPWIAISLALTFGLYGLAKKVANLDSIIGLAMETLFVTPVAFIFLVYLQVTSSGSFGTITWETTLLLIGSGVATALPLLWFAQSTKRIPLSTVGFLQYLAPTISLLLGIFVFKESFTTSHVVSFGFIWLALLLYSLSNMKAMSQVQPKAFLPKSK